MMDDPVAIVMEKLPGRINTGAIEDSQRQQRVRDAFIDIVAKVHRLPLSAFHEVGLAVPSTPEEIALSLYAPAEAIFERLMGERPFPIMRFIAQRSEAHTSELQSLMRLSYAVFCLKKKTTQNHYNNYIYTTLQHIYTKYNYMIFTLNIRL